MSKQLIFVMLLTTLAIVSVTHGATLEGNPTEGNLHEGNPTEGTTIDHDSPTFAGILQRREAAIPQAVRTDDLKVNEDDVVNCCSVIGGDNCAITPRSQCRFRRVELNEEEKAAYLESLKSGTSTVVAPVAKPVAAPAPESVATPAPESVAAPASESVVAPAPAAEVSID